MEGIGSFTPLAVSGDGSTIVGRLGLGDFDAGAVIWDPIHGLRNVEDLLADLGIDFTGWTLASVRGISADGLTIAGEGRNPSGIPEGWIAVIPEPSTGLLLASGLAGLAALAACRRSPRNGAD
jgi:hypothetical protein